MNTFLGASSLLTPDHFDFDLIANAEVLYMEGYLFDRGDAKAAFRAAAAHAHRYGRMVSLTLSDSFCVERHRDDFRRLLTDEVDILFGNAEELVSLYEADTFAEAVTAVRADCPIAVVTMGERGSLVITPSEVIESSAHPVSHVVDTTGAGDLFAAGFLCVHPRGRLAECARIGGIAAAEVIAHVGPRPRRVAYATYVTSFAELATAWLNAEPDDDVRGELQPSSMVIQRCLQHDFLVV